MRSISENVGLSEYIQIENIKDNSFLEQTVSKNQYFPANSTPHFLAHGPLNISFRLIQNDGTRQNLKLLLDLKNVFTSQLVKMDRNYIVQLVFDRNHQSIVILNEGSQVVGGICFREFKQQRFAEVAFLAVSFAYKSIGLGSGLMTQMKEQMQRRKIENLITYADDQALNFFKKQGFTTEPRMAPERWKGYTKDYLKSTIMQCYIHPTLNYAQIGDIIWKQKQHLINDIKTASVINYRFAGTNKPQQIFVRVNSKGQEQIFKRNPMTIPGVNSSGWTWKDHDSLQNKQELCFILECQKILDLMKAHSSSWPFRQPVSTEDYPNYPAIIKESMDLKKIEVKLNKNEYSALQHFCDDISKMFKNCRIFNENSSIYCKCANTLEEFIKPHLQTLTQNNYSSKKVKKERKTKHRQI